jgi:hypothetical protein
MHHGSEMNLDCCEVMATTVNYDMIIIILDNIYSMLSWQLIPPKTLILLSGHAKRARHFCTAQTAQLSDRSATDVCYACARRLLPFTFPLLAP